MGQAQVWAWLHASNPQLFSARCAKILSSDTYACLRAASSLQRLQALLAELKLDAENLELQSSVEAVKAQFKQTSAQLGLAAARKPAEKLTF